MKTANRAPKGLDAASVSAALLRAVKRAHFIAYQNGEGVVMSRNGKPVIVPPDPAMYGELLTEVEKKRAMLETKHNDENHLADRR